MKVSDIHKNVLVRESISSAGPGKSDSLSFEQLLASQLSKTTGAADSQKIQQTSEISPSQTTLRLESLSMTEKTIQTLDKFEAALKNNSFATRELEPYISSLEEETAALVSFKNQLDSKDPLATLLDRVASVSYVESTKYRRGDYNS